MIGKSGKKLIIAISLLYLVILVISGMVTKGHPNPADELHYIGGWVMSDSSDDTGESYYQPEKKSYILTMHHDLTEKMYGKVISFRTNDSYVDAEFISSAGSAGAKLYHFGEKPFFGDSPGTYTHFIKLPDSGSGTVTIHIETAYKNKFLSNYDVAIGSKNELIYGYLRSEAAAVFPNMLLIIFGLLLSVIYFVSLGLGHPIPEALSLSGLTIVFTIYANCPLFTNQCIFRNAITQYYLNYLSLFLLPLLAILYFEDIVPELKMKWLFYGFVALETALTLLHFSGIASYTRTIKVFIASMGIFALISVILIAKKFKKITTLNKLSLVILIFFMFVNVLFFIFVSTLGNQSFLTKIGMLLYISIAIIDGLQKIMRGFFKKREDELLHKIAYTDNLTKLGNRYALERDVQNIPLETVSIVSIDLNYLKYANDTFGHNGGDVLLKAAADCISAVYDKVYRVGGDEFIALVDCTDSSMMDSLADSLQEKMVQFNRERTSYGEFADHEDFILSIAAGYSSYQHNDTSYEQIMNRADKMMYQIKKRIHSEKYSTT